MYAHILVGLDGSEVAEQILPDVEALGEKFHCTVTLLRAIVPLEQAVAAELGVESLFVDQDGSSKMSSANPPNIWSALPAACGAVGSRLTV